MSVNDAINAINRAIASLGSTTAPTPSPLGWQAGQTIRFALIPEISGVGQSPVSPDPNCYSKWQFVSFAIRDPSGTIVGYNNWVSVQ